MRMRKKLKKRLAQTLTAALAASLLTPSGGIAFAAVGDGLGRLERTGGLERGKAPLESGVRENTDQEDRGQEDPEKVGFEVGERITEINKDAENSGTCGDQLTWNLKGGILTIRGTGMMKSYGPTEAPWYENRDEIIEVIVEDDPDGKSIGSNAFNGCVNLTTVKLPDHLYSIGRGAFQDCRSLTRIEIPPGVPTNTGTSVNCIYEEAAEAGKF